MTTASPEVWARMPGQLAAVAGQQVVGPFEPERQPGARADGFVQRHAGRAAEASPSAAMGTAGRTSTEKVSPSPGGDVQTRSKRPRPDCWCSAASTLRSGAPVSASRSALVEAVSATTSIRGHRAPSSARSRSASSGGCIPATVRGVAPLRRQTPRVAPHRAQDRARRASALRLGSGTMAADPSGPDLDPHTTAGKLADLERRYEEAVHAGSERGGREAARQGQDDRPRADPRPARRGLVRRVRRVRPAPLDGVRHGQEPPVRRRRRHRCRHGRRPARMRLQSGRHRLRRRPRPGVRREDRQGARLRDEDRLPRRGHQRGRRRADPGRRGLARSVRRDLPPHGARVRRHPADLADHGRGGGRARLLPRAHRLHRHGRQDLADVHHRPGRGQDGHR